MRVKNAIDKSVRPKLRSADRQVFRAEHPTKARAFCRPQNYSHSMVLGGLVLMSYTTRLTPWTSLTMRVEIRSSTA